MYATTTVPSLDELGGILTLQRLTPPSVHISHIGWDEKNKVTVAILEGEHSVLTHLNKSLERFNVSLEETRLLQFALVKAKKIADVVEFVDERKEDTDNI